MKLFTPEYVFKNVTHISPAFLKKHGIRALALDVDNTLTSHDSQDVSDEIAAWLQTMRDNDIQLLILSNNYEERVAPFAEKLGLDYTSFTCKPLPTGLRRARHKYGLKRNEIAVVGDQLFTDMLAGKLDGVLVLLVRPMSPDIKKGILFKRKLESPFILRYYKKGGKLR